MALVHTRGVKLPYSAEIDALPSIYEQALKIDITDLQGTMRSLGAGPAVFVGSGGTIVLATLAARLHEQVQRQPALVCTSLELLDLPQLQHRGALLFSSSVKHPDALRVLGEFRRSRFAPAAVLTHRTTDELGDLVDADTKVLTLPRPSQPDGFLATGSVLQMATLLLRSYLGDVSVPDGLPDEPSDAPLRDEILVLSPPSLKSVAADIEVRLVESGLAPVQVTDFRNFAHGRHTGFSRRLDRTTVLVLSDAASRPLAQATSNVLPEQADIRRWFVDAPWPEAIVTLLARSMQLAGDTGATVGVDVARPQVPGFGRRLYRLPLERRVPKQLVGGVERKLLAAGAAFNDGAVAEMQDAATRWLAGLHEQKFAAVTLDYDGTVCWTSHRFELPDAPVRTTLLRLLDAGVTIGFASGRGRSLYADLRRWIPSAAWPNVRVGLYNGAVRMWLDEELGDLRQPSDWSTRVASAIRDLAAESGLKVEERGAQVSVSSFGPPCPRTTLASLLADQLERANVAATIVASGHSLDIIATNTRKSDVSLDLQTRAGGAVIALGDQGQLGGNDHQLLASTPWSLTVNNGSADPTRCWFGGPGDRVGPDLLASYLKTFRTQRRGFAVRGLTIQ